jgi:hypothetical protein
VVTLFLTLGCRLDTLDKHTSHTDRPSETRGELCHQAHLFCECRGSPASTGFFVKALEIEKASLFTWWKRREVTALPHCFPLCRAVS